MKKRLLYLILPIITLFLETLPYGAVLIFANPEGESSRHTYSYFDLTPYGYANFAPFITAILTCIIFVLLVVYCINGKRRVAVIARNILCVCAVLSLGQLVYGISYISAVSVLITVSLVAEALVLHFTVKKAEAQV